MHTVEGKVAALGWIVEDLREWRAEARVQLEDLVKADEIAEAVAKKMRGERTLHLTWVQKAAAFVVGAVAVAGGIKGLWA